MKAYKLMLLTLLVTASVCTAQAQTSKKDKAVAKEAAMKTVLESKDFTFTAQTMNPLRGGSRQLTSEYDVRIVKDSVISYLPFFGRAYVAPMDPTDNPMHFTSTKFSYESTAKKNGYQIIIKPLDTKDVRQMVLDISTNGYGTLSVTNTNRDPVSFYGYVEGNKKETKKDN